MQTHTQSNTPAHTCAQVTRLIYTRHNEFICDILNVSHECHTVDMSHMNSFTCDVSILHVTWLIHMCHDSQQLEAQQQSRYVGARHGATPGPAATSAHKSYVNESRHMCISHVTCTPIMSHINESYHIYLALLQRHIWMSHVTYQWVMSHMNESCHIWMSHVTYEWVMSHMNASCHIWMRHVTYEWVTSHMNESCYIWMCHVTY